MHSNVITVNFRRKPAAYVRVPLDRPNERRGPGLLWWFSTAIALFALAVTAVRLLAWWL